MVLITRILRAVSSGPVFRPVTHAIFDIDGLILHTEDIYYKIDQTIVNKYGKTYPWDVRLKVLGRTEQDSAQMIVKECGLSISVEQYLTEAKALQNVMLREATLLPGDEPRTYFILSGAERLVRHLAIKKVPMALATSSGAASVEAKTSNYKELFTLFHHIVMGSSDNEVKKGKPAPDIFLICASRFEDKPDPGKCLVFEDAPNGVTAAKLAGMQVVMVPDKRMKDNAGEATLVLPSLLDFRPELFNLPQFEK